MGDVQLIRNGCKNLLFVREFKQDSCSTAPYTFLGTAEYVSHTGFKPMDVIWKLDNEILAKYLKKTMYIYFTITSTSS